MLQIKCRLWICQVIKNVTEHEQAWHVTDPIFKKLTNADTIRKVSFNECKGILKHDSN